MKICFAPMEGITGYVFRNAHHKYFGGVEQYYTPFISPNQTKKLTPRELNDVLPEHNEGIPVIPQILTNRAEDFLWAAGRLKELGYREVNLNLGCPSGTVVAKHKGSGFLALPMELDRFLYQICDGMKKLSMEVSVKTRIGKDNPDEFEDLLSIYNRYPLELLVIHPRLQIDYYKNNPNMEVFKQAAAGSKNPICYNGNLFSRENLRDLSRQFPAVEQVMVGRGLLTNPAFAEETGRLEKERFRAFHDQVLEGYRQAIPGDKNVMFKMKELWFYLGYGFEDGEKYVKKIRKAQRVEEYCAAVSCLLANRELKEEPVFPGWQ